MTNDRRVRVALVAVAVPAVLAAAYWVLPSDQADDGRPTAKPTAVAAPLPVQIDGAETPTDIPTADAPTAPGVTIPPGTDPTVARNLTSGAVVARQVVTAWQAGDRARADRLSSPKILDPLFILPKGAKTGEPSCTNGGPAALPLVTCVFPVTELPTRGGPTPPPGAARPAPPAVKVPLPKVRIQVTLTPTGGRVTSALLTP